MLNANERYHHLSEDPMQTVEIRVKGQIDLDWSDWIGGLTVSHNNMGETVLTGLVQDQAALYGLLARLADLGLQLNSVTAGGIKVDDHVEMGNRKRTLDYGRFVSEINEEEEA
jgi:hypothetical protein